MSLKDQEIQVIVKGRVQGVGFRWATRNEALRLNLVGWVRNLPDGSVESVAQGPQPALETFLEWVKHGPPTSQVDEVRVLRQQEASVPFSGFEILR